MEVCVVAWWFDLGLGFDAGYVVQWATLCLFAT
jgi:hypothetical protein